MSSYKIYNLSLNQIGGAKPKSSPRGKSKGTPKGKSKGLAKPKGLVASENTDIVKQETPEQLLKTQIASLDEQIKKLQDNLTLVTGEFTDCENRKITDVQAAETSKNDKIAKLQSDAVEKYNKAVENNINEQSSFTTAEELQYANLLSVKQNELQEVINKLDDANSLALKQTLDNNSTTLRDENITKLKLAEIKFIEENKANYEPANIIDVTPTIIQNAFIEYTTKDKNKFAKEQLIKLCPKDTTNPICKNLNIPADVYEKDPYDKFSDYYLYSNHDCKSDTIHNWQITEPQHPHKQIQYVTQPINNVNEEQCRIACNNSNTCQGFKQYPGTNTCILMSNIISPIISTNHTNVYQKTDMKCYIKKNNYI